MAKQPSKNPGEGKDAPPVPPETIDAYAEGFDTPERREAVSLGFAAIEDLNATSAKINADKKAVMEGLEALGLNRHGVAAAFAAIRSNARKKQGYKDSYQLTLSILDVEPPPAPGADPAGNDEHTRH